MSGKDPALGWGPPAVPPLWDPAVPALPSPPARSKIGWLVGALAIIVIATGLAQLLRTTAPKLAATDCLPADTATYMMLDSRNATAQEVRDALHAVRQNAPVDQLLKQVERDSGQPLDKTVTEAGFALFVAFVPEEPLRADKLPVMQSIIGFVNNSRGASEAKLAEGFEKGLRLTHPSWRFHELREAGVTYHVLDGSSGSACYVIQPNWVLLASSRKALARSLDAAAGRIPRLTDDTRYKEALQRLRKDPVVHAYIPVSEMLVQLCRKGVSEGVTDAETEKAAKAVRYVIAGPSQDGVSAFISLDPASDSPLIKALLHKGSANPLPLAGLCPSTYGTWLGIDLTYAASVVHAGLQAFPGSRKEAAELSRGVRRATGLDLEKDVAAAGSGTASIGVDLRHVDSGAVPPVLVSLGVRDEARARVLLARLTQRNDVKLEEGHVNLPSFTVSWRLARQPQKVLMLAFGFDGPAVLPGNEPVLARQPNLAALSGTRDVVGADCVDLGPLQKWFGTLEVPEGIESREVVVALQQVIASAPAITGAAATSVEADGIRVRFNGPVSLSAVTLAVVSLAPVGGFLSPDNEALGK